VRLWGWGCYEFWTHEEDRYWNSFDFFIVLLSTFDTVLSAADEGDSPLANISVLRIVRVVRIVRVLRIIRVMKFFQDLRILLAAVVSTVKTAGFAFALILLIMYMFGIAITQLVAEHIVEQENAGSPIDADNDLLFFFGSIGWSVLSMFMTITGGIDWKDASTPLYEVSGGLAAVFFLLYVCIMSLCVMNVLLGIFCQCALDTAASDKENVIQLQLMEKERFVKTLKNLFADWDETGRGTCSIEAFEKHMMDETTMALLRSLEIEGRDAITLFDLLDTDMSGEVDLDEFVTGCITLRGGAKAIHMEKINGMNKTITKKFEVVEERLMQICRHLGVSVKEAL